MSLFLWGDEPTLRWPWVNQAVRTLSTETCVDEVDIDDVPDEPWRAGRGSLEIPDPQLWGQTSRRYRTVEHRITGEKLELSAMAFAKFRERGGDTLHALTSYILVQHDIPARDSKRNEWRRDCALKGWRFGYEGEPLRVTKPRFVHPIVGTFAAIGALCRLLEE